MFDAGVTEALLSLSTITTIENLLPSLMKIVHQYLDVEKSILILPTATEKPVNLEFGQLEIASIINATLAIATGQNNSFTFQLEESILLADYSELPLSLIHQIELTHETLVIDRTQEKFRFSLDSYFVTHNPRNLLCLPLIDDSQLVGIFYLENSLNPEGFTENTLETIQQIATQATASLFNLETNLYQLNYAQNLERQIQHLDIQLYATVIEQHQAESKLFQRERYLSALVEVQQHLLLSSEVTQVDYSKILKILGQVADASRAYIFQNYYDFNGNLLMSQVEEWCALGIESEQENLLFKNLPYDDYFPRWNSLLAKDEIITGIVKDFPQAERNILEAQNIAAILILPIIVKDKFWGFIGFDNCLEARQWQDAEINLLRAATSAIVFWLERQETQAILNRDRALLKGQQEASLDGILVIDECHKIASYNQRFCQLWNISETIVSTYNSRQLTNFLIPQLVNPEEFLERINYLDYHLNQSDQDEIFLKDGRIFDYYSTPIKSDFGEDYGKIWYFRDITEARNREKVLSLIVETTASQIGNDFFYSCVQYSAEIFQVNYAFLAEPADSTAINARTLSFWQCDRFIDNFQYCLDNTPCQELITEKQGKFLYSVVQPFPPNTFLGSLKIQSYLGMPISDSSGHNILGHLVLMNSQPIASLTEQQELILKIFLTRIGVELERRKAQQALEKAKAQSEVANQAKTQFLAQMSHELRTPLNAILGFTEIMTNEALDNVQQKYLEIINKSGKHLLNLINDVLDMSKIEAGQVSLEFKRFNLADCLNDIHEMFVLPSQTKGLQLITQTSKDIPEHIVSDENKLRQVLINLLSNAIKFTKTGEVNLTVSCKTSECLLFQVRDTGSGIAPEELELLFEPFIQTKAGRKSGEGTGLGLSITSNFVRLLGGEIQVESVVGVGTTFSFQLPLNLMQFQSHSQVTRTSQIEGTEKTITSLVSGQPEYRILVVDDNPANRTLLLQLLTKVGFTVREADNGQQAVKLASDWHPHLIWMDLQMPVMDGFIATQKIKAHHPHIVIIALTANVFVETKEKVLACGFDDSLHKPCSKAELLAKMQQHLGIKDSELEYSRTLSSGDPARTSLPPITLNAEMLKVMPPEWIEQLYLAAIAAKEKQILALIEQIPQSESLLAQILTNSLESFCLEEIINCTAASLK
ncbi:MAG: ATP-binding protein [Pleurocapsa sp.]